jgi:hypothetical protein
MVNFQIGQCRITVDTSKTESFYLTQPRVTELCDCLLCTHYEQTVIHKPVRIYEILTKMGVDLTKYDKNDIEGVWHIGERDKFENSYLVYYKIFGQIDKTQNKNAHTNEGGLIVVDFFENEVDSFTKYSLTQVSNDTIEVRIEIECDRK